ncbi:MAG: YIP1 family protein [Bacteroidetes bacterium]|nr:YIP1 family protein [Bacteroidota bacterium]
MKCYYWLKLFPVIILLLAVQDLNCGYTPLTAEEIYSLIPSPTRYVASLYGKWESSLNEKDWVKVTIPYSSKNKDAIIYKRTIRIDDRLLSKLVWHLYFLGVDDQAEVYFNNQYIGKYLSTMAPFAIRIPERMMTNESNTIKLVIFPATSAARQMKEQNINSKIISTGVPREVLLIGTPQIWVSQIKQKMKHNDNFSFFQVSADVNISSANIQKLGPALLNDSAQKKFNIKGDVLVDVSIKRKETGEIVARTTSQRVEIAKERTVTLNYTLPVNNPILWTPSNPELYEIEVRITKNGQLIDQYSNDIGFRHITTSFLNNRAGIYLNDSLLDIKGLDYIEDYYATGTTLTTKRMERDILMMKTLGANLICVKYALPHPYFLNLCDQYGMMVMVELPVCNVPHQLVGLNEVRVKIKNIADLMLTQYSNHPSIIAWGISEGLYDDEKDVRDYTDIMSNIIKKWSSNLVYKTVNFGVDSIYKNNIDFVVLKDNHNYSDFDDINNEIYRLILLLKDIPSLINYGLQIQPFNHNGFSDPASLESQANYISNFFRLIKAHGFAGSLFRSFNDYGLNHPLLIMNNNNLYIGTSGLVDRGRQERLAFLTLQSLFNNEKEPLLNAGSYNEKNPLFFMFVSLFLVAVLIFLMKRFRRFREYVSRSFLRPFNFYADIRDQRIMSSVQTFILGFVLSITLAIFIVSILYYYRTFDKTGYLLMLLFPSNDLLDIIFRGIWMPEILTFILSLIFFGFIFLIAGLIKLFSLLVKGRIYFSDTYTITIWSGVPLLVLLPLDIILSRLLFLTPLITWILIVATVILIIWVLMRTLKATAIVFDIPVYRSYIIGIGLTGIAVAAFLAVYQYQYSFLSYIQYFFKLIV